MSTLREHVFQTDEVSLAFAEGPKSGSPLLFCHGVLRGWQDFSLLIPAFLHRWQVYGLDFRGHGASGQADGAYRVMDYARDTVALLRQLDEPAVVYGHSLGALVACAAAAEAPECVRAVVLEDPPFEVLGAGIAETPFHSLFTGMRDARLSGAGSVRELAAVLAEIRVPSPSGSVRLGDVRDGTQLRFSARCLLRVDPAVFDPLLAGHWLDGYDLDTVLPRVTCPALLLAGNPAKGGMLEAATVDRAAALMPDCIRVDVPEAGHLLHWTHRETVLRLVTGFVESL